MALMEKAIFIDKDGTLIENIPFNSDPEKIKLFPDAGEALKLLKEKAFKLIVITNQPGIALGYFKKEALEDVRRRLQLLLERYQVQLDGFYYCPHDIKGCISPYSIDCPCRKPKPGMLLQAAQDMDIDLSKSWMLGDILHDVEAGTAAGCRTVLVDRGNETEWQWNEYRVPTFTARQLKEAAVRIVKEEEQHKSGWKNETGIEETR